MENTNLVERLTDYVSKETAEIRRSIVSLGDSFRKIRVHIPQVCKITQSMSERMYNLPQQLTSVPSDLQEEIQWSMHQATYRLKTQILAEGDKKSHIVGDKNGDQI